MLIAAINSSAGSLSKSSSVDCLQTARSRGQTCTRAKIRVKSAESRSSVIRPNWASFAISQRTIADTPHEFPSSNLRSAGLNEPASANSRMWVSRLSIPFDSGGEDVARYIQLAFHAADQVSATGLDRNQPGHRFAMLRYDDAAGTEAIEQGKALLLELRCVELFHARIISPTIIDWSIILTIVSGGRRPDYTGCSTLRNASPVKLPRDRITCSGVPAATRHPPSSPPSGPRSITQSAHLITSRLCSITSTVFPRSTSRCSTSSSLRTSSKCSPVVGSSST